MVSLRSWTKGARLCGAACFPSARGPASPDGGGGERGPGAAGLDAREGAASAPAPEQSGASVASSPPGAAAGSLYPGHLETWPAKQGGISRRHVGT